MYGPARATAARKSVMFTAIFRARTLYGLASRAPTMLSSSSAVPGGLTSGSRALSVRRKYVENSFIEIVVLPRCGTHSLQRDGISRHTVFHKIVPEAAPG